MISSTWDFQIKKIDWSNLVETWILMWITVSEKERIDREELWRVESGHEKKKKRESNLILVGKDWWHFILFLKEKKWH
jgi:hypothetical protein